MYQFLEKIKSLKPQPECTACKLDATAGQLTLKEHKSRFVMCSGCSRYIYVGLATNEDQPNGHAQDHKCS
jgi:ubiquitin carboxyl-terminal hydrolase 16/45